jgi:hypothetical protein
MFTSLKGALSWTTERERLCNAIGHSKHPFQRVILEFETLGARVFWVV